MRAAVLSALGALLVLLLVVAGAPRRRARDARRARRAAAARVLATLRACAPLCAALPFGGAFARLAALRPRGGFAGARRERAVHAALYRGLSGADDALAWAAAAREAAGDAAGAALLRQLVADVHRLGAELGEE